VFTSQLWYVFTVKLETPEALMAFAKAYAKKLEPGTVIILSGSMGAGKTTFVQGLALGLGVTTPVSSPTYTYIHEYDSPTGRFVHIDAYRLEHPNKLWDLGLAEYLENSFVTVIEWGAGLEIPEAIRLEIRILISGRELIGV
jgi:tRNA threonylcarbamoyladenosine biosynthesis protein TsaE